MHSASGVCIGYCIAGNFCSAKFCENASGFRINFRGSIDYTFSYTFSYISCLLNPTLHVEKFEKQIKWVANLLLEWQFLAKNSNLAIYLATFHHRLDRKNEAHVRYLYLHEVGQLSFVKRSEQKEDKSTRGLYLHHAISSHTCCMCTEALQSKKTPQFTMLST